MTRPCAECGCAEYAHIWGRCLECDRSCDFRYLTSVVAYATVHQSRGGDTPMAHLPNTRLPALRPSADKKWLHCPQCSKGYWGAFRPTDFVAAKFAAHVERKHADKAQAEAGAEAPAADKLSDHAGFVPAVIKQNAARQRANAKAAKKGDGALRIIREDGPRPEDLLGQAMADLIADAALELDPRLQLAQGPRDFPDVERDRPFGGERKVRDANKGQDVMARVQAQLSPLQGWA